MEKIKNLISSKILGEVCLNYPLKEHTSFKIGGGAELYVCPNNLMELITVLNILKENDISYFLLGAGSNLLIGDGGVPGAVIKLGDGFDYAHAKNDYILAGAGVSLAKLSAEAKNAELTGLEFASGIPGTLGGAIFMNAGAYGGEMKDVITEVSYIDSDGSVKTVSGEECDFGYRKSMFSDGGKIIISAKLILNKGNKEEIITTMRDLNGRRKEKQPLEYPSAGSTFKRPEGHFAGALIEEAGLKGYTIGGAQVSEKHAGFVINKGDATAKDVMDLIAYVQGVVRERSGVDLEPEVKIIGEK